MPWLQTTLCMLVVEESLTVIEGNVVPELLDVVRSKPVAPRERQRHLVGTVILNMALRTDVATHLRAVRIEVWIIRCGSTALSPFLHGGQVRNLGFQPGPGCRR
jgi:hypothetical protein